MNPIPLDVLPMFSIAIAIAAYFWGYRTGKCSPESPCPKCVFHANEGRIAKVQAKQKAKDAAKAHAAFRHDYDHKGGGWRDGDPDRYNCPDATCPRNRQNIDSDPDTLL